MDLEELRAVGSRLRMELERSPTYPLNSEEMEFFIVARQHWNKLLDLAETAKKVIDELYGDSEELETLKAAVSLVEHG